MYNNLIILFLKDGKSKVEGAKLLKMAMQMFVTFKLHIQP
jgi:hypothetical protein